MKKENERNSVKKLEKALFLRKFTILKSIHLWYNTYVKTMQAEKGMINSMTSIFDVVKYILHQLGSISTMKLQKLCYYSQAWSLVWDGQELFPEDFQAWVNGSVCPILFNAHKGKFFVQEKSK